MWSKVARCATCSLGGASILMSISRLLISFCAKDLPILVLGFSRWLTFTSSKRPLKKTVTETRQMMQQAYGDYGLGNVQWYTTCLSGIKMIESPPTMIYVRWQRSCGQSEWDGLSGKLNKKWKVSAGSCHVLKGRLPPPWQCFRSWWFCNFEFLSFLSIWLLQTFFFFSPKARVRVEKTKIRSSRDHEKRFPEPLPEVKTPFGEVYRPRRTAFGAYEAQRVFAKLKKINQKVRGLSK